MLLIIVLLSISISNFGIDCSIKESWFKRETLCNLDERISAGCSKKMTTFSVSLVRCASFCSQDATSCRGASVDENGHCFLHWNCPNVETSCTVTNPNHNYRKVVCAACVLGIESGQGQDGDNSNEGPTTVSPTTERHTTESPTTASQIESFPSCHALDGLGYSDDDFHRVYIAPGGDVENPFHVLCDGSYSLIFMRNQGNTNFNRTWLEYQQGFYIDNYNLWGGLDLWVALSNAGYVTIMVANFEDSQSVFREYEDITITDAADGYRITYSSTSSGGTNEVIDHGLSFGDCLGLVQNMAFSTWDRDNTEAGLNCAAIAGSGWWYFDDSCSNTCNLLGYGDVYWGEIPSNRLFSVPGLDMIEVKDKIKFLEIYMKLP